MYDAQPYLALYLFNNLSIQNPMNPKQRFLLLALMLLSLTCTCCFSQNNENLRQYHADEIYLSVKYLKDGTEMLRKPLGSNVLIFYNNISKSIQIYFTVEDGSKSSIILDYIKDEFTERSYSTWSMRDKRNVLSYVNNWLDKDGSLKLLDPINRDGKVAWFIVENATRIHI